MCSVNLDKERQLTDCCAKMVRGSLRTAFDTYVINYIHCHGHMSCPGMGIIVINIRVDTSGRRSILIHLLIINGSHNLKTFNSPVFGPTRSLDRFGPIPDGEFPIGVPQLAPALPATKSPKNRDLSE